LFEYPPAALRSCRRAPHINAELAGLISAQTRIFLASVSRKSSLESAPQCTTWLAARRLQVAAQGKRGWPLALERASKPTSERRQLRTAT
jgi:hypothetical protein